MALPNGDKLVPKNLVFEGGGVLIVLYAGAAYALEEQGILAGIQRTAGASTGAVASLLVGLKLSAQGIQQALGQLDFSKIPQVHEGSGSKGFFNGLLGGKLECFRRLFKKYGYYSNEYFYQWLLDTIGTHTGNPRSTFADFRARGFAELQVAVTNLSRHRAEYFSAETSPDVAVADAIRLSTAIPLYFQAMQFDGRQLGQGDYFIDGGFTNNYPLSVFDNPKYGKDNPFFYSGINWETLGFYHHTPPKTAAPKPIKGLLSYSENLMATLGRASDLAVESVDVTRWRTVNLSDCGVGITDFSLKPSDPNYGKLFESGKTTTAEFLAARKRFYTENSA